ncbi:hypothetical protein JXB27_03740 [Candidatus Woesearchaeota archaeon]|nr:hypothetical protein [Candidatus Woesearchaeota archaeon]
MKKDSARRKIWNFIWHDDSLLSWIVNLILAFFIIKYLIFPAMGFALGSQFPMVAVVSSSMEHDGNFDSWWSSQAYCGNRICTQEKFYAQYNISKEDFQEFIFRNGFNKGDVMVLSSPSKLKAGDVVVFFARDGRPIIHRVISLDPLQTKGDHNQDQIENNLLNEKNISRENLIGKVSIKIPWIGYVKIIFAWVMSLFGIAVA